MSAEILRRAASLMRERAEAATPGPWSAADEHGLLDGAEPAWCVSHMRPGYQSMSPTEGYLGDVAETSLGGRRASDQYDAEHIASWHPAVALAVADWLDSVARDVDKRDNPRRVGGRFEALRIPDENAALIVARAYLGGAR